MKDKFTAHGQILAGGKAVPRSPVLAISWFGDSHQRIRIYYFAMNGTDKVMREIYMDDGVNPTAGPLNARNVTVHKRSPLAGAAFKRDGVANVRLYYVGTAGKLREYLWGANGQKEWALGAVIRDKVYLSCNTRLCCANSRPWNNETPGLRLFGYDLVERLYEHVWDVTWGTSQTPEFDFAPINNSIDCVTTRLDFTPITFFFWVPPYKEMIVERSRVGETWSPSNEAKEIQLDRVHPFSVVSDPIESDPDNMHIFLTNGRDFMHYHRSQGYWNEKAVPQVNDKDDLTDVDSIIASIDAAA
ncbi:hypothetical protein ABW20_dc0103266 [Dactylellina cionopaga]|nr:hypothetical protein ABW20_dc0103266 [Dactylellina cionopaga]